MSFEPGFTRFGEAAILTATSADGVDVPLADAARIAGWCHAGHCADTTADLPRLIDERRTDIAERIAGLQALDARLAGLGRHLAKPARSLAVLEAGGPCCEAAEAVVGSADGGCSCCAASGAS